MSQNKKIIHDIPEDVLLEIALKGAGQVSTLSDKLNDAIKFIYDLNVKQGDTKITAECIYYTYKQYRGVNNKRVTKVQFFRDFKKYFDPHRNKDGIYYLLNPKPFDLTEEGYWAQKADSRNAKTAKKKQKK